MQGGGDSDQKTKQKKKKRYVFAYFFVLMLYIKFQVLGSSGSLVLAKTKGVTDRPGA